MDREQMLATLKKTKDGWHFLINGIKFDFEPTEAGDGVVFTVENKAEDWEDIVVSDKDKKINVSHG